MQESTESLVRQRLQFEKIRTKQEIYGYFGLENPGLEVRILSAPVLWSCGEMVNTGKRTVFNILVLFYILLVKTQMLINIGGLMV